MTTASTTKPNRYAATCATCGNRVPAQGGTLSKQGTRWEVRHLACREDDSPQVYSVTTASGWSGTRNRRGRCEDAPCCGCCTY